MRRAVVIGVLVAGLVGWLAPPASADVLVHVPDSRKCVGKKFKVGVWYQAWSGGPRGVRVRVVGPNGKTVLRKSVRATGDWRYWPVRAKHRGAYRTIYKQGRHGKPAWKQTFRTRAHRCRG